MIFFTGSHNNEASCDGLCRILTIPLCISSTQSVLLTNKWEFLSSSSWEGWGHLCTSLGLEQHVNIAQGSKGKIEFNSDLA